MNTTDPTTLLGACETIAPQGSRHARPLRRRETGDPVRAAKDAGEAWARGYDDPREAATFLRQFGPL